jgi:hypothetical protein
MSTIAITGAKADYTIYNGVTLTLTFRIKGPDDAYMNLTGLSLSGSCKAKRDETATALVSFDPADFTVDPLDNTKVILAKVIDVATNISKMEWDVKATVSGKPQLVGYGSLKVIQNVTQ